MVRHAAQQQVQGKDGGQEAHGGEYGKSPNVMLTRCHEFISLPLWNARDYVFITQTVSTQVDSECNGARKAASAHPAAVRAEMLPYAVPNHLPAAPSPKQQPALQPVAYRADYGSQSVQENLRAGISES